MDSTSNSIHKTFGNCLGKGAGYGAFAGLISSGIVIVVFALIDLLLGHPSWLSTLSFIPFALIIGAIIGAIAGPIVGAVFYFKQDKPKLNGARLGLIVGLITITPVLLPSMINSLKSSYVYGSSAIFPFLIWLLLLSLWSLSSAYVASRLAGQKINLFGKQF